MAEITKMQTILLVDDSSTIRNMLKAFLNPLGYRTLEAAGGRAGLEHVRQEHIDLIITDQNMPGMDGLTMVKSIREGSHNKKVPIMVLTTETSDEMKSKFRAAGANGWMSKPFSPERLEAALKKFFG
jgi:two-component system chemotaxis response regulator CheY